MTRPIAHRATNNEIMARLEALAQRLEDSERERAAQREKTTEAMQRLAETSRATADALAAIRAKLGEEPNSDGAGGSGLIGDLRKHGRDLQTLLDLRKMALGALAALTLTGTLIYLGTIQWIQGVIKHAKP